MEVYVVNARAVARPGELETLGIFDTRIRAQEFMDRVPTPQRECLEIHTWTVNDPISDPFWTGEEERSVVLGLESISDVGQDED